MLESKFKIVFLFVVLACAALPIAGIMIPLAEVLPFREPWFWITTGVVGLSVYHTRRKFALGGNEADFQQLQAEVRDLKARLLRQELSASLLDGYARPARSYVSAARRGSKIASSSRRPAASSASSA